MRQIAETFGWVMLTCWIAGSLGFIDFHLCIEKVGQCSTVKKASKP